MPLLGVSRKKRIDSSFQCCIKDGSRPTAYAVHTEYANHLKVLYSKDMVLNESKPTEDMSKWLLVLKSIGSQRLIR